MNIGDLVKFRGSVGIITSIDRGRFHEDEEVMVLWDNGAHCYFQHSLKILEVVSSIMEREDV